MELNWKDIDPITFEKLCFQLLHLNNFSNLEWIGKKGGDKGRDILCQKIEEPLSGIKTFKKWLIQCKRYINALPGTKIISEFLEIARQHIPDCVLLIITNTLNPNTKDWLKSIKKDYKFEIFIWEELVVLYRPKT